MDGLLPEVWALLFKEQCHLLDQRWPWLHQKLGVCQDQRCLVKESTEQHPACPLRLWSKSWHQYCRFSLTYLLNLWSMDFSMSLWTSAATMPRGCCARVLSGTRTTVSSASSSSSSSCSCSSSLEETPSRSPVGSSVEDQRSTLETTLHCSFSPPVPIPAGQDLPQRICGRMWGQWQVPLPRAEVTEPLLLAATGAAYQGGPGVPQEDPGAQTLSSPAKGRPTISASKVPATIPSNKRKQMSLSLAQSLCTAFSPFSRWLSLTPHPTTGQEAQGCMKRCVSHDDGRVTGKNTVLMLSQKS